MEPVMPTTPNIARRRAIASAAGLLCAPAWVRAQAANKPIRIAILAGDKVAPHEEQALLAGLRELGWVEGRNLTLDRGYTEGRVQQMPGIARDLAALKPDAVIATCTPTTRMALQAFGAAPTSTPIVMAAVADPVGQRLVVSLARPGANVTGRSSQADDLMPKKLELFARALGKPTTVAVLVDSNSAVHPRMFEALLPAAQQLKLELVKVEAGRRPTDVQLPAAFATAVQKNAGAVLVLPDEPFFFGQREQIATLAARHGLPSFYGAREFVDAGGLMSYGESLSTSYHGLADYIARIAAGAKPGDLPIAQPTQFELVINMKTAKALGLNIPQSVLVGADELIR
jgi:putative tryptophan/tyrosine transport system substrate-binding protein